MAVLRDEELIDVFDRQLPDLLERRPDLEPRMFKAFLKAFARREEVAVVLAELRALRAEVDRRFEQVDRRFERLEGKMDAGFGHLQRAIDRLGARWGIRNESVFRQTMATVLEESFGVTVEQRTIDGEQFDVLIFDHQHILVEIAASVGRSIQQRLERKRRLYTEATGVVPARMILATASIHSQRAHDLRQTGIEVVEPEDPD
jgi:hypothetical protein